jgi:hypothetical protein
MEMSELFDAFFKPFDTPSHLASLSGRTPGDISLELTYGQIHVPSWKQILEIAGADKRKHFIDLGSGSGKALLLTLYLYPHIQATGVELLPKLHELAQEIAGKAEKELGPCWERLTLLNQNLFETDLKPYDLLQVNSTCYEQDLVLKIIEKLKEAQEGALIISIGKALKAAHLKEYFMGAYRMGWQSEGIKTPIYMYEIETKAI